MLLSAEAGPTPCAGLLLKTGQEGNKAHLEVVLMAQQTPAQREQVCSPDRTRSTSHLSQTECLPAPDLGPPRCTLLLAIAGQLAVAAAFPAAGHPIQGQHWHTKQHAAQGS